MLISESFDLYRDEVIYFNGQSARTLEVHNTAKVHLIKAVGDKDVSLLTMGDIAKWRNDFAKTHSANTVRGYVLKIRVVIRHLNMKGIECLNYALIGVPKRENKVVCFLEPFEVDILIDKIFAPHPGYSTLNRYRNRAIVALLFASGIRVSELCSLTLSSIKSDGTFTVVGKGNKPRLCFTDERSRHFINEYLSLRKDFCKSLFISEKTKKGVTKETVDTIFRFARKKCDFEKPVTPHTIRHSFATDLLRKNTNLVYVQRFLGHESIQTTQIYTHVVNEDLRRIYIQTH